MKRLIAFGCSHTYGHGLPDCWIDNDVGNTPSKLTYVDRVAAALSRECVNKSMPGASNKTILDIVLKFNYQDDDLVLIQWSYPHRSAVFSQEGVQNIGPWNKDLYEYKDYYDSEYMSKFYVNHANLFLTQHNIEVYNLIIADSFSDILELNGIVTPHLDCYMSPAYKRFERALDGEHPGEAFHEYYSEQLVKRLTKEKQND